MKRILYALTALLLLSVPVGMAQNLIPVNFQSKWFPQAQFAGYFVAQDKGFYAEEGLDVTVLDGGNVNPTVAVASGNADFGTDWLANILVQREQGLNVVYIGQMFQVAGYRLVALKSSGIETFADMAGRKVGVWAFGNEFATEAVFAKAGLTSSLDPTISNPDVEAVVYAFDPGLVFPNEVDVASAMTYNELDQIVGLGYDLSVLNVLNPADIGADILEDGVFANADVLATDNFKGSGLTGKEVAERFLRASIRGWQYAVDNQEEAVNIVLKSCGDTCAGSGSRQSPLIHQTWMMAETGKLVKPTPDTAVGSIDRADFERSVQLLVDVGLIKTPYTWDELVDPSIYDAIK
ncbi:MAG: ABC transporter substrate-binding protein, partial [Trueperaceae bacterium]|jgi:NitT/TauT family transport system substrate-binding protein|nr:ABC transporter substrate-binding protein [Truepera sp.]HRN18077.1 ABC transporter substrate-binding protein [Trueperaceae bacterium]HRQ10312.1 ABC transporter substrate-binding protein [Trueperaceae bacterium]